MSSLNFPLNPTTGTNWVIGGTTWVWNGKAWVKLQDSAKSFTTVTAQTIIINGTTSTDTVFTMTGSGYISGDVYANGTVYSNGSQVITTSSLKNLVTAGVDISIVELPGNILQWNNTSTLQSVTDRGSTTTNVIHFANTTESTSTVTGSIIVSGGAGIWGNVWAEGRVTCESLKIADSVFDSTLIEINTTATTVVDTYSIFEFRSAEYLIQIDEGTGPTAVFQMLKLLLLVDNTGAVYLTEYGSVISDSHVDLGTFEAGYDIANNTVNLYFTAAAESNKIVKVLRTGMAV